jgi:hypothetical protein
MGTLGIIAGVFIALWIGIFILIGFSKGDQ